ncbi:DUF1450 domain-containing protein [Alicyclobacillus fructus]|uniref:DUF1450 domain-containing protein n=1 Tax=Alicyclobacillus fructus TaxID=2816082 RepID=UPI001A8F856F|nr:DUF1450 domain-containing protein [Alicyclobacillus fructus]
MRAVEWCAKNAPAGVREAIALVRAARPDAAVRTYACVDQCALCARQPFAIVDGQVVTAPTPERLARDLVAAIDAASGGADSGSRTT